MRCSLLRVQCPMAPQRGLEPPKPFSLTVFRTAPRTILGSTAAYLHLIGHADFVHGRALGTMGGVPGVPFLSGHGLKDVCVVPVFEVALLTAIEFVHILLPPAFIRCGGTKGSRTLGLLLAGQALSQLSYGPMIGRRKVRPAAWQTTGDSKLI